MLKPVHWLGLSLTLAGICALPALADGMDAPKTDGPARPAFSDTNKDGVLSKEESLKTHIKDFFDIQDANKDGKLKRHRERDPG